MSQPAYSPKPATLADVPAEWIANVAAILLRDGQPARAGFPATTIEIQNTYTPTIWQPLNLPTNTSVFATEKDRDAVLDQLWRSRS